jgi:hypothetical protein
MKRLGRGSEECRGLYAEYRRGWKFSSRVRVTGCMASCCCTNAIRCKAPTALAGQRPFSDDSTSESSNSSW